MWRGDYKMRLWWVDFPHKQNQKVTKPSHIETKTQNDHGHWSKQTIACECQRSRKRPASRTTVNRFHGHPPDRRSTKRPILQRTHRNCRERQLLEHPSTKVTQRSRQSRVTAPVYGTSREDQELGRTWWINGIKKVGGVWLVFQRGWSESGAGKACWSTRHGQWKWIRLLFEW